MTSLISFIVLAIGVSFLCSILEAVILSLSPGYLASLEKTQPKVFKRLKPLRDNVERPLAAILSLNTVAHTVGASGAGAQAQLVIGDKWFSLFTAVFTFAILIFSEIIPKSIGARFWKPLSPATARILPPLITLCLPLVWVSHFVSKILKGDHKVKISRDEFEAITRLGLKDGALSAQEYQTFRNILTFPAKSVSSIMRPMEEVSFLSLENNLAKAMKMTEDKEYSRYPVLGVHQDDVKGYVLRSEILREVAFDRETPLKNLVKPILHVQLSQMIQEVFLKLIKRHEHISAVLDGDGKFVGIVTLEDMIETILGLDIKDETD